MSSQSIAEEESFFHWELEYPEVFFGEDGSKLIDAGFDAVIGNPPWLGIRTGTIDDGLVDYLREEYSSAVGQFDLAAVFLDRGISLVPGDDVLGFVVPKRIATNESYEALRQELAVNRALLSSVDLGVAFEGVNNDAMILITGGSESSSAEFGERISGANIEFWNMDTSTIDHLPFTIIPVNSNQSEIEIVGRMIRESDQLGEFVEIERGAEIGMNHEAISEEDGERSLPIVDHLDVGPYAIDYSGHYIDPSRVDESDLKDIDIYRTVPKLLVRFLAPDLTVAKDDFGYVSTNLVYHVACGDHVDFLNGLLSSKLLSFWYFHAFQNDEVKFPHVQKSHIDSLPTPDLSQISGDMGVIGSEDAVSEIEASLDQSAHNNLSDYYQSISPLAVRATEFREQKNVLNANLLDHVGSFQPEREITELGLDQPPEGASKSPLTSTTKDRPNLRVGGAEVIRQSPTSVEIRLTARYKPDDEDAHETDQWGYTETEPLPALQISELTETEADLIEHFVPVAVEEAGGFANFRETATKTNSLVDRLRALTLPDVDDVREGLESYIETKERAEELEAKIERTDELIDEIVYELYGLSEEEIEIVEEAVDD